MNGLWQWLLGISAGDMDGAEGWSLRFEGMPSDAAVLLALLALLAAVGWAVVRWYRQEHAARPRARVAIAGVRLAVLVLLFLVLLQPALVVRFARVQSDGVAVLVDDTLSMGWRDRYAEDGPRRALAAVAGVAEEVLGGDERITRSQVAGAAMTRQGGMLDQLAADRPLYLYRFGVTGEPNSAYVAPLGREGERPSAADWGQLKAQGRQTDVGRAVREVLNRLDGRRLAAVVLVTDGRNTVSERARLAGAAQVARQRGVRLYCVGVGDPLPPRNVGITQLVGPREARAASKISFTATLTQQRMPAVPLQVKLYRSPAGQEKWEDTGAWAEARLGPKAPGEAKDDSIHEVTITTEAPPVGSYAFKARIEAPPQDSVASDNEATAIVRVTDQKMKVLLIAGSASWEYQFLRNLLIRGEEHYAVTLWQQNADERFNQDASTGMKRSSLPTTLAELAGYDVVVLCDPRHVPGSFDERFVDLLDQFVGKHQGGLCYLAGAKFATKTLSRQGSLESLSSILPVTLAADDAAHSRTADERQAITLELTSEGQGHPALRLAGEERESIAAWRRAPEVYRCGRVARLKPLASSLIVQNEPARSPQQEAQTLVAVQHYGRGPVLYFGIDGTWRLRPLDDAAHYERLWSNIMEFLGSGRLEKNRIVVGTVGEQFDAGSDVEVRVEAHDRDLQPLGANGLWLEVRPLDGGEGARHLLRRDRPGHYVGVVRAQRVGAFELTVRSDDKGNADWTEQDVSPRRIQVRLPQAEFLRPEADFDSLRELAGDESRFAPLHEVSRLSVPSGKRSLTSEEPHPLWSTRLTLILGGALLLLEWTLRKANKMM
jgi:hypothetical protein